MPISTLCTYSFLLRFRFFLYQCFQNGYHRTLHDFQRYCSSGELTREDFEHSNFSLIYWDFYKLYKLIKVFDGKEERARETEKVRGKERETEKKEEEVEVEQEEEKEGKGKEEKEKKVNDNGRAGRGEEEKREWGMEEMREGGRKERKLKHYFRTWEY